MTDEKTERFHLAQLKSAANPRWALFLSTSGKRHNRSAFFQCLLESKEMAVEVARQYASDQAQRGNMDFSYYVVELKHQVGISDGKIIDLDFSGAKEKSIDKC